MDRLSGKVLLVTGAARGLGAVVARLAVAQGANVLLSDTNDELGATVANEIGDGAAYLHLDVREKADWDRAVDHAQTRFGHLDVLVNNAAILKAGHLETFALDDYREVVEVNQTGAFLGMQAVVPAMRVAGRGSIVN